ncbi:hypothetical protein F444_14163 [Phytophthora nicotianae P1976]|uniref:Uncharacterized protein n=1 Tax=Phytophthora nicotianae P1976 TaxID=1317066 RepID=A0A080ZRJ6_PHYNI|nr:hypothetical protein F444_14163 [Phytophthora nicotianae P1976]
MLFSVDFFSRPFDHFLSSDDSGGFRHERTVFRDDAQWGGPEPAPSTTIRSAGQLHQVLYVPQDAASLWYPECLAAVFRVIHGDTVQNVPTTAPTLLLTAMCNLYQAVFYEIYDDIRYGVDLRDLSTRAARILHRTFQAYQQYVVWWSGIRKIALRSTQTHSALDGRLTEGVLR